MVYAAPIHTWNWTPKGPARRLTGEEVALRVFGIRYEGQLTVEQILNQKIIPDEAQD